MKIKMLPIILIVVAMAIYYFTGTGAGDKVSAEQAISDANSGSADEGTETIKPVKKPLAAPPVEGEGPHSANSFVPTKMEDGEKFQAINREIQAMSKCLNMIVRPLAANQTFNAESLHNVISTDLGDVVDTETEWQSVDIRTAGGEVRRLFLEFIPGDDGPKKRLTYYTYKGGSQQELPLTPDQKNNPSDTLLASLESDGEVMGRSRAQKIFYQNGDDLQVVEKNGMLYAFSIPHDGSVFACSNLDKANLSCSCKH